MALHASDDRFPDSQPVLGHIVEFESGTTVLDEDFGTAVRDFKVHGHRAAAVPGGDAERLQAWRRVRVGVP